MIDTTSKQRLQNHVAEKHALDIDPNWSKADLSVAHGRLGCSWRVTGGGVYKRRHKMRRRQQQLRRAYVRQAKTAKEAEG